MHLPGRAAVQHEPPRTNSNACLGAEVEWNLGAPPNSCAHAQAAARLARQSRPWWRQGGAPWTTKTGRNLIGRLFAQITAQFENGAGLAADGQSSRAAMETRKELAEQLRAIAVDLTTSCEATSAICDL